jgi:hypothetical protein
MDLSQHERLLHQDTDVTPTSSPSPIQDQEKQQEISVGPLSRSRWHEKHLRYIHGIFTILALLYILVTGPVIAKRLYPSALHTCGATIEEAKSRGCAFDPLTVTWLPARCSRYGVSDFLHANGNSSWGYWDDQAGTIETKDLGSKLGKQIYWTTEGEHLTHCAYILIRSAKAHEAGDPLDRTSGSFHHTQHCAMFLLEAAKYKPTFHSVITAGNVALGAC